MRDSTFKKFKVEPAEDELFLHTFRTAFRYYWISQAIALFMLLVFLFIVRRKKHDVFEWVRMTWRLLTALLCLAVMCLSFTEDDFVNFIASPWVVLSAVILMTITVFVDRLARWAGIWHFRRRHTVPLLTEDDHDHRHDDSKHNPGQDRGSTMIWGKQRPQSYQSVTEHTGDQTDVSLTAYRPSYISVDSIDEVHETGCTTRPNTTPPVQQNPTVEAVARPDLYHDHSYNQDMPYGGGNPGYYDPTHIR